VKLRFDDPRTCAGAFALLCTGVLVLALPVLGPRAGMAACGLAGVLVGASPMLADTVCRVLVRRAVMAEEKSRR
jgi:hypothetical protein